MPNSHENTNFTHTHYMPFVRIGFSGSAHNCGLETTLKPFGLRRLNKSAHALGPVNQKCKCHSEYYSTVLCLT